MFYFSKPPKHIYYLLSDEWFFPIVRMISTSRKVGFLFKILSKVKLQNTKMIQNFGLHARGVVDQSM